jgi:hypothetical protein
MLAGCGLKAHPDKTVLFSSIIEYLGHNISAEGLTPHEAKVAAIRCLRVPTTVPELRSVMGFLNYYRCYIKSFSVIAAPLNKLLGKDIPWEWTDVQQHAYLPQD